MIQNDFEGFLLEIEHDSLQTKKQLILHGTFGIYVNPGCQYSIWYQFPQAIHYTLKDLDSGLLYQSMDMELSISWAGNSIYDMYAQWPCEQIVVKNFSVDLEELCFGNIPQEPISNFEIHGTYIKYVSNTLKFTNAHKIFKTF